MNLKNLQIIKNTHTLTACLISLEMAVLSLIFLIVQRENLPEVIPLFYSKTIVSERLVASYLIYIVPLASLIMLILNMGICEALLRKSEKIIAITISYFSVFLLFLINLFMIRVVLVSAPTSLYIPDYYLDILLGLTLAFILGYAFSPLSIIFAVKNKLIDNPNRDHPAILHTKPTPRGGALAVYMAFLITIIIFVPLTQQIIGIILGASIALVTGLADDKYDLNPYLRLLLQVLAALVVVGFGVGITFVGNPLDGVLFLDTTRIVLAEGRTIVLWADIVALVWIVWVMNVLNWSTGVDGQFPGISSITLVIIGLLSIRLLPQDPNQLSLALLAFITAGAVLGTLPFNWHRAKMFYGFGLTMVGLIIASSAILSGSKIAVSLLILIVPTTDAVYTILRRLRQKKSPVWGDANHLHHQLLRNGWSHKEVALFYILTTSFFGTLALITANNRMLLTTIIGAGIFSFVLVLLNSKNKFSLKKPFYEKTDSTA